MMEYKGYIGRIEFDDEAGVFHGEVVNTRDVITLQGKSVRELRSAFHDSINDYLAFCAQRGEQPDKPCSGQFVTRITPELHRLVTAAASLSGKSLNTWVREQLQNAVQNAGLVKSVRATKSSKPKVKSAGKVNVRKRKPAQAKQHA